MTEQLLGAIVRHKDVCDATWKPCFPIVFNIDFRRFLRDNVSWSFCCG